MKSLTKKDKIEQFKRDLRSLHYYECCVKELDDDLLVINERLLDVSSPTPKEVIAGVASSHYYTDNKVDLIMQEEKLAEQREVYQKQLDIINAKLKYVDTENIELLKRLYVKRVPYQKVADEQHMSLRSLRYYVNKLIENII